MPEVQIRHALTADLPILMAIDHSCETDYVWQMDVHGEDGQAGAVFWKIRLPHPVTVPYPRPVDALSESWGKRLGMLVTVLEDQVVGYVRMNDVMLPRTAWLTDVVVSPRFRRQGIGTALLLAAQSWAMERKKTRALLEMSSKNYPAICLAHKLGYEFCGYNDQYYDTQDIAIYFGRSIR